MILPAVTIYHYIVNITSDSEHSLYHLSLTSVAPELTIPNGILVNSYSPSGVTKAVLCTSSGATGICQYPLVRSIYDKYFLPISLQNKSSAVVMVCDPVYLSEVNTHPVRTILLLHHDNGRRVRRCQRSHHSHLQHSVHFVPQFYSHGIQQKLPAGPWPSSLGLTTSVMHLAHSL